MAIKTGWLKYLWRSRRNRILHQSIRMAKLHRTPFWTLLENIFEVTEQYQGRFTFPTVASTALKSPELVRMILTSPHEIAAHGFKHVNYRYLPDGGQEVDIKRGSLAFRNMKIPIHGFRAPYNAYTDYTPKILEKRRFLWDGGIGYAARYRDWRRFFRIQVDGNESSFVCIPLCELSDDYMIDECGLKNRQMVRILRKAIKETAEENGVIMFDLHPIRIGQPEYIDVLTQVLAYGTELGGWFPTVTDAVNQWCKHKEWKHNASFCCLLTGDIDNFTFTDYLSRLF